MKKDAMTLKPASINVSVVMLTKNRKEMLGKCLDSLFRQRYTDFEIIVVDDSSTDGTVEMVKELAGRHANLTFLQRSGVGLANGRNTGVLASRGRVIAFIDDDCVAHEDWLKNGLEALENEKADIVRGAVVLPDGSLFRDMNKDLMLFATANIMYKRKVFDEIGLFDEKFVYCAEDRDFGWRAVSRGFRLTASPEAVCYHPFHYNTFLGGLKYFIRTARFRSVNRVLLYKKHKEYRSELVWGIFYKKWHMITTALIIGVILSLINLFTIKRPLIYEISAGIFLATYLACRVFVDVNMLKYPKRMLALPYFLLMDSVETFYTVKGAIKYRYFIL
jgi:glycosyltransferase involved in cell wall biosynthesis